MKKKMEFGYEEIPINFLSKSPTKNQLGAKSPTTGGGYHNMSVPVIQMLRAERDNKMKEAEKKQLADKALKQKLKLIAQGQRKLTKNPSESGFKKPSQPKGEQILTGTSYRILRLPSNLPAGYKAQTEATSPRLDTQVDSPFGQKLYTSSWHNAECESPMKGSFVSTTNFADKAKHYKSYASLEINYGAKEENHVQTLESENENPRLNLRLINSYVKTSPNTLQTLADSKTPELKVDWNTSTFEGVAGSQFTHIGISPKKRMLHQNSVLKQLHQFQGFQELSPLERNVGEIKSATENMITSENKLFDRRGGTSSPIKLKVLSQNPSQDRLFPSEKDFIRENKSFLPKIAGLEEETSPDLVSSEILTTEGNTSKKKKAAFNFGPEVSKFLSLPKGKSLILPKNPALTKRLKSLPIKDKIENRVADKSPTKGGQLVEFKLKTKTAPQNPIFSFEDIDGEDAHIRHLVASSLQDIPEEQKGKIKFEVLRRKLLRCLKKMKILKVTPQELLDRPEIFKSEPYAQRGSKAFLEAAKLGRLDEMQELIEKYNRYLIYTFDNVQMTALHFAAKKGYSDIASFLVATGANVDAKDIIGRTPLYFAIQNNNIDILKILLANGCSPWSNEEASYTELCKNNLIAWFYLSKMRKLDITLKLTPPNLREIIWQRESTEILRRKYVAEKGPAQKKTRLNRKSTV